MTNDTPSRRSLLFGLGAAALTLSAGVPGVTSSAFASEGGDDRFDVFPGDTRKPRKPRKRKTAKERRSERKRKAEERKKEREKAKKKAKAKRREKYRKMTGKDLEKGMPSDRNFGSLKGSLRRDIDKAPTRKAKAKVARRYARVFNNRANQVQGRSAKTAAKYRSFAGNLSNYADAQSK